MSLATTGMRPFVYFECKGHVCAGGQWLFLVYAKLTSLRQRQSEIPGALVFHCYGDCMTIPAALKAEPGFSAEVDHQAVDACIQGPLLWRVVKVGDPTTGWNAHQRGSGVEQAQWEAGWLQ